MSHIAKDLGGQSSFTDAERAAVYRAIFSRRDVRRHFTARPVSDDLLLRLLTAAHHAPSVGFMQPWNFIVIRSDEVKQSVHEVFQQARKREAREFEASRQDEYRSLKLEGICEAPLNLCVTCDRSRHGPVVLGRTANHSTDLYSTVCAIQNLWLAARTEGVGVGWVSILDETELKRILAIPEEVVPVAYLCIGHVDEFPNVPDLESAGWLARMDLAPLIFRERWKNQLVSNPDSDNSASPTSDPNVVPATKRLTLIRHASTIENEQHRYIGSTDSSLSASGKQDAKRLALLLAGQIFERIWHSPMLRAKQTLAALADIADDLHELPELREIDFGHWEGRTYEELQQDARAEVEQWNREGEDFSFPGGESIASFRQRIDQVVRQVADDDSESLLIVTHGGVIRHLICRLLGLPIRQSFAFRISPASVTTIEMQDGNAVLTSLNFTPAGEM